MNRHSYPKDKFVAIFFSLRDSYQNALIKLMKGKNDKQIGEAIGVSSRTAGKYITQSIKEFGLHKLFPDHDYQGYRDELKFLLKKYEEAIFNKSIEKNYSEFGKTGKTVILLEKELNEVSPELIGKILDNLQQLTKDTLIRIVKIEISSIKLTVTGSIEGCQRLKEQFDAGELTDILDIPVTDVSSVEIVAENNLWTNIRTWLESDILPDWDIEEIVGGTIAALRANPDFSTPVFGSLASATDEESVSIPELLNSLNSEDLNIVRLAAQRLGEIEANTPEVINRLKHKLNTVEDVQTQWQIALTLGKIVPVEHPQAKAQKQTIELGDTSIELVIATKNDEDDFIDILVEIRPDWDDYLPIGLEAKILEESGEEFWLDDIDFTRQVNEEQSYICFSFWGTPGDRFILQLSLENTMLQKKFQI